MCLHSLNSISYSIHYKTLCGRANLLSKSNGRKPHNIYLEELAEFELPDNIMY